MQVGRHLARASTIVRSTAPCSFASSLLSRSYDERGLDRRQPLGELGPRVGDQKSARADDREAETGAQAGAMSHQRRRRNDRFVGRAPDPPSCRSSSSGRLLDLFRTSASGSASWSASGRSRGAVPATAHASGRSRPWASKGSRSAGHGGSDANRGRSPASARPWFFGPAGSRRSAGRRRPSRRVRLAEVVPGAAPQTSTT